jgi:formylmethanofuran dehydrogenase subunit E
MNDELIYCEKCFENLEDDLFDYRFERPICLMCADTLQLTPDIKEGEY